MKAVHAAATILHLSSSRRRARCIKRRFEVPIWGATMWLEITDDMERSVSAQAEHFPGFQLQGDEEALCLSNNCGRIGLFFRRCDFDFLRVAHEVYHATVRILEWAGAEADNDHHEHAALLHGWLMDRVCHELGIVKARSRD